jgi:hypothetical protein
MDLKENEHRKASSEVMRRTRSLSFMVMEQVMGGRYTARSMCGERKRRTSEGLGDEEGVGYPEGWQLEMRKESDIRMVGSWRLRIAQSSV